VLVHRISLGPRPWLHRLRRCFVQFCSSASQLHGEVRLPASSSTFPDTDRRVPHRDWSDVDLPVPARRASTHARLSALRPRGAVQALAHRNSVGTRRILYEAQWLACVLYRLRGRAHARLEATPSSSRQTCTFAPILVAVSRRTAKDSVAPVGLSSGPS
jgi:hypothetical protein